MKYTKFFPSRFLKSEDLDEPRVLVIASVGNEEMEDDGRMVAKFAVKFEDGSTLICNLTNGAAIAAIVGSDETDDWIGKSIELYRDRCQFRARLVPCIRVRKPMAKAAPHPAQEPMAAPVQPVALPATAPLRQVPQGLSAGQRKRLFSIAGKAQIPEKDWRSYMRATCKTESTKELTQQQYTQLCDDLESGAVVNWLLEQAERAAIQGEAA
jgi:hypothetical protein